ncbi:RNA polymerase sigma-70 factor, ECF subfamily [Labilithrix luteola]|uniref:RNA polymerase sigma-70 factor, ECF subfamily n=1 Tax=Labilithrix luteola TaxID=1391654 RepID=A0A0K1Q482_9BACT|nr:sigma-70 family RNA polymerase sigma factor [Labilithrix luteola]AKV00539.1 RNA polymerase sigma-70 factor, ECF subfamily [Labilithrix luteola]
MNEQENLFRREFGRLVAVLTRLFGVQNLALAEDVAQDTLVAAFETWQLHGVPEHYAAWLTTAAKNRALDVLRRRQTVRKFEPELTRMMESEQELAPVIDEIFEPHVINDHQLRMMFSCCHPRLPEEAQVALILQILCGFTVNEIANAFLVTPAAMDKRISRAKKELAESNSLFDLGAADFTARLSAVQRGLYLLFSEGYHGANSEGAVRTELCREAMHLVSLLLANPLTATSETQALYALMCIDAARLPERTDDAGNLRTLFEQDRSKWVVPLVAEGLRYLERSAKGDQVSEYHVQAAIAALYAAAPSAERTRWADILSLYDLLMAIRPSPVVELNRAIVLAQHEGAERGLEAIRAIEDSDRLKSYPFYAATLGELESRAGRPAKAREYFLEASELARSPMEKRFLEERAAACA